MTQNAKQAKKSRSFTVGVSFRLSSYYSLVGPSSQIVKSGPCVKNRSTIRKLFENNGSHIMKGFTCSVNKGDMVNFGFHYQIWIRHEKKCTFGIFSWWNHPTFCNVWIMSFEQGVKFWNWCWILNDFCCFGFLIC